MPRSGSFSAGESSVRPVIVPSTQMDSASRRRKFDRLRGRGYHPAPERDPFRVPAPNRPAHSDASNRRFAVPRGGRPTSARKRRLPSRLGHIHLSIFAREQPASRSIIPTTARRVRIRSRPWRECAPRSTHRRTLGRAWQRPSATVPPRALSARNSRGAQEPFLFQRRVRDGFPPARSGAGQVLINGSSSRGGWSRM